MFGVDDGGDRPGLRQVRACTPRWPSPSRRRPRPSCATCSTRRRRDPSEGGDNMAAAARVQAALEGAELARPSVVEPDEPVVNTPVVKTEWEKTGRNDPCPADRARSSSSATAPERGDPLPCVISPTTWPPCAGASTRRRATCASTSCGGRGPSSRPRRRAPTCGTTRIWPARSTGELSAVAEDLELWDGLAARIDDAETLFELGREEERRLGRGRAGSSRSRRWPSAFDELELRSLFTGEHDEADAICEIQSGAGGADAQDWANMLLRMDLRWAERRRLRRRARRGVARLRGGHLVGHVPGARAATPTDACAPSTACTAWCASRRSTRRASARPRSPRSRSRPSSRTCPTSRSTRRTCASTPTARRGPAASTST